MKKSASRARHLWALVMNWPGSLAVAPRWWPEGTVLMATEFVNRCGLGIRAVSAAVATGHWPEGTASLATAILFI